MMVKPTGTPSFSKKQKVYQSVSENKPKSSIGTIKLHDHIQHKMLSENLGDMAIHINDHSSTILWMVAKSCTTWDG
jgi:hypothetical protein